MKTKSKPSLVALFVVLLGVSPWAFLILEYSYWRAFSQLIEFTMSVGIASVIFSVVMTLCIVDKQAKQQIEKWSDSEIRSFNPENWRLLITKTNKFKSFTHYA